MVANGNAYQKEHAASPVNARLKFSKAPSKGTNLRRAVGSMRPNL